MILNANRQMKNLLLCILAVCLLSGCSMLSARKEGLLGYPPVLSNPKPRHEKYGIQIVAAETPITQPAGNASTPWLIAPTIEQILEMPDAKIMEYRTLYAPIGERIAYDQTITKKMLADAKVVDGKTVRIMNKVRLGHSEEVWITEVDGQNVTYKLNVYDRRVVSRQTCKLENGDQVEIPFFESRGIDTKITQPVGPWKMVGGWTGAHIDNGRKIRTAWNCYVRLIPPK